MLKTIIFDFDGVIGDTYDIYYELCKEFFKDLSEQDFKDYHNGNVFQSNVMKWKPQDLAIFFEKQKQKFTKKHLFPLKKVISELQKKYQLLVISSTIDENVRYFLGLGGYNRYFQGIFGATTHKSKVEKFKMIFRQYSLKPKECLFITDTIGDIKEAKHVNVESIAVTWGYHDKELLSSQNPLAVVQKHDDLLQAIEKHSS